MTHITPILGDTEIPLVLTFSENGIGGVNGLTVLVANRRVVDGFYLDWNDDTFKNAGWTTRQFIMLQPDSTNSPGLYEKKWDSSGTVSAVGEYYAEYEVTTAGKESVVSDSIEFQADLEADIAGLNDISPAEVNVECDTAIAEAALATASNLATVDTVVDVIKAVTNLLPNAGALNDLATILSGLVVVDSNVDAIKAVTDLLPDGGALTALLADLALARKMLTNRKALTNGKIGNLITFDDDDSTLLTQDASDVNGNDISLPSGVPARTTKGV